MMTKAELQLPATDVLIGGTRNGMKLVPPDGCTQLNVPLYPGPGYEVYLSDENNRWVLSATENTES